MTAVGTAPKKEPVCSIARTLDVVGDKWTLLILREAILRGVTKFAEFRQQLGIAPDILTNRLTALVDHGILEKQPYQEPGSRSRFSYHLTPAGDQLRLILVALQQWGDDNRPLDQGPSVLRHAMDSGRPVRVAFVDDADNVLRAENVGFTTASWMCELENAPR